MTGTPVEVPVPRKVTIMDIRSSKCRVRTKNEECVDDPTFLLRHSNFELRRSYFEKRELAALRIDDHRFSTFVPRRDDGHHRVAGRHHHLFVKVSEHDVRESFPAA